MNKYITLKVVGKEDELLEFVKVCGAIQYAGNVGSCRTLRLTVDGDGSGQLKFKLIEKDEEHDLPSTPYDDGDSLWIGE